MQRIVLEGLAALATLASLGATTTAGRLDSLRWLAGCWELRAAGRVTREMWMPPDAGLMLGASRTSTNGTVREFEQLLLAERGDRVVYTARPSGQAEASFTAVELSDSGFVVENPAHDFPQRIIYRRRGADSLLARIEGPGSGGVRGIDYPMRRVPCTEPRNDRSVLLDADRVFSRATAQRRADGWVEYFAEDGAMIRPAGTITGRPAIREAMTKAFADSAFSISWEPQQADVGATGELGYTLGRYVTRSRNADGRPRVVTGRYLTVWRRQPDGSWRVVQDIGVQDAPTGDDPAWLRGGRDIRD